MEILVLVTIGIGVAFAVAQSSKRKVTGAWKEAASQLHIHHNAGDFFTKPELYGLLRGCRVKVTIRAKHRGHTTRKFTRYEVSYPQALPFGLSLTEQSAFSTLKRVLGGHDIEVGDSNFDDFVVVFGHDSTQVREYLNPARRLYVRRILSLHRGAEITDSCIRWDSTGLETEPATLVGNVRRMVDFAVNMTARVDGLQSPASATAVANASGHLGAISDVTQAGADPADGVDSIEVAAEHEPLEPKQRPTGPAAAAAPQAVNAGMYDGAERDALSACDSSGEVDHSLADGPNMIEVCQELFASDKISLQIDETFRHAYAGLEVHWSGRLTRADDYPFDLVFGSDPGTKAEFEIAEMPDSFGARAVKAVVQLPAEVRDALCSRIGETIGFTGTLVRCDSFARVLFIAHGSLLEP